MPTHLATIELLDRATGQPLAIMDGRLITEMRTAAVSAVAVQTLAPGAKTLGILGSGVQARSHIEALRSRIQPAFREPGAVKIWSRNPDKIRPTGPETGATAARNRTSRRLRRGGDGRPRPPPPSCSANGSSRSRW
jgi:ornithine cyclodeaminase/alanine dehydrogenase-like protein (mu-crystallin family)